jgi:large subunit ribosomal protein L10
LNKEEKQQFVTQMKERLQRAQGAFVVDYRGLKVEHLNRVRNELRKSGTEFFVVKNRLLKLASLETTTASIKDQLVGPCAVAITYGDVIAPAKTLIDLNKQFDKMGIKVGQIAGRPLDMAGVRRLAQLPGRDELLAQFLSDTQGVPTSFVRVLNGVMVGLLNVLKAVETKKGEGAAGTTSIS